MTHMKVSTFTVCNPTTEAGCSDLKPRENQVKHNSRVDSIQKADNLIVVHSFIIEYSLLQREAMFDGIQPFVSVFLT